MIRGKSNSCGPAPYEVKQLYVSSERGYSRDCDCITTRCMHIFITFTGPFMGAIHLSSGSNHHLTGC